MKTQWFDFGHWENIINVAIAVKSASAGRFWLDQRRQMLTLDVNEATAVCCYMTVPQSQYLSVFDGKLSKMHDCTHSSLWSLPYTVLISIYQ